MGSLAREVEMTQLLRERKKLHAQWGTATTWGSREAADRRLTEIRARLHVLGFHGLA